MTEKFDLSFYKEHPKTCDPDDFWGQVKRTVNGKPIAQEQIDMIVDAVCRGLALSPDDTLLDLCCGNGALTTYFFEKCSGGVGVDFSEPLITVAHRHFVKRPQEKFILQDVVGFVNTYEAPERFTKALCYGSFMFLPKQTAYTLLKSLGLRFQCIKKLYIGNLPDKSKMSEFFADKEYTQGIENDPGAPIGIWRMENEFIDLAGKTGWHVELFRMPEQFYAAHYRFDAILTPLNIQE